MQRSPRLKAILVGAGEPAKGRTAAPKKLKSVGVVMDARLNAFLERAESVLARLEPLLPAPRPHIDWSTTLAAR
jgi:hypothetical protein